MIKDIPIPERPMEKLMASGVRSLSDSELLANILRSGTKNRSSLELSQSLLMEGGGLKNVSRMSLQELRRHSGIGAVKACQLIAAFELGRRTKRPSDVVGVKITSPRELVDFFKYELADEEVEKFLIVNLSSSNTVISWDVVTKGILNASLVHPREIFRSAIRACAFSIIALHNHPSGNVEPSNEDFLTTRRLYEVGKLMGISLLDHIVVAGDVYYSFKEHGKLG